MISIRASFIASVCAAVFLGTSCMNYDNTPLMGEWIEENENYVQGFRLSAKSPSSKKGMAESIGTKTLCYSCWEVKGDKLILTGLSIGNRTTSEFKDTLKLGDVLVRTRGDLRYHKLQHLDGIVRFAEQTRTFLPAGNSHYAGKQFWLIDPSGKLLSEYVHSEEEVWERPVSVEGYFCQDKCQAEFSSGFDGILKLVSLQ